jgi:hypothetical protein
LYYLDLAPQRVILPTGKHVGPPALQRNSPRLCFWEQDLYTTTFSGTPNDEIERFLFGAIDREGANAVRAILSADFEQIHNYFLGFFAYLDAQKLRTPKGLDWIKSRYSDLNQLNLMLEMQQLRQMHCTMWLEAVREIVSAENSDVKFIITDHPVTIYHAHCPPASDSCVYPGDPEIALKGSQTLFPLGPDHCLILTNLEYAQNPDRCDLVTQRQNARYFGETMTRIDAWIRSRKLSRDEVIAINHILKSRARRFIAAAEEAWLYPERAAVMTWDKCGKVLLPPHDELWHFGGETYIGYKDGGTGYQDAFGRTSPSYEYLKKKPPKKDLAPDDCCSCGSARLYGACCRELLPEDRMPSDVYSIRERNLMFIRAVEDILGMNEKKNWNDIRRELSDDQVKRIHIAYASLWPKDTDIVSLLPRPDNRIFRALYVGLVDARTIGISVIAWLRFFDEIYLLNPFVNGLAMRPEYSPIEAPSKYKEQTLKNVALLFSLAPYIQAGIVHLIPDLMELNTSLRNMISNIAQEKRQTMRLSSEDLDLARRLGEDDFKRTIGRLPDAKLRALFRRHDPGLSVQRLDQLVKCFRAQHEEDPLALLQPFVPGEAGGQVQISRGINFELAMFLAQLVGAAIYTSQIMTKKDLNSAAGVNDPHVSTGEIHVPLALKVYSEASDVFRTRDSASMREFRIALRALWNSALAGSDDKDQVEIENAARRIKELVAVERSTNNVQRDSVSSLKTEFEIDVDINIPSGGYGLNVVRRFLITFGRRRHIKSVPCAILFGQAAQQPDGTPPTVIPSP